MCATVRRTHRSAMPHSRLQKIGSHLLQQDFPTALVGGSDVARKHSCSCTPGHGDSAASSIVRVGIYGAGVHSRNAHAPNLRALPGVEIVAIADSNLEQAQQLADDFAPAARLYNDGHAMLQAEQLDAVFSVVPAFARPKGVEVAACLQGVALFSEKPQTLEMETGNAIADAVSAGGVVSSVGFRERYRPIFRAAKDFLANKSVVHVMFRSWGGLPGPAVPKDQITSWWQDFDLSGGGMFDWGCHAVDYVRFMTGQDIVSAQAWYNHPVEYSAPLSASINFRLEHGATMTSTFVQAGPAPDRQPWFTIFYVGGCLTVHDYDRLEDNGVVVYDASNDHNSEAPADGYVKGQGYDPWYEHDRCFVEDVRDHKAGRPCKLLVNDYADGLKSLAPVLAAWESARQGGKLMDVKAYAAATAPTHAMTPP